VIAERVGLRLCGGLVLSLALGLTLDHQRTANRTADVRPVGVASLKNRALSPSARFFVDSAREIAKPLAKRK